MKQKVSYDLSLTDDMTVREVERIFYDVQKNGLKMDDPDLTLKTSAVAMWKTINMLRFTPKATEMKIKELREWASIIRSAFISIHRVNYSAFNTMVSFYDWYEEKRRMNPNIKRYWKKTEEVFRRYQQAHRECQERSSWMLLQDHMRLVDDAIQPTLRLVEPTIVNVFISQRAKRKVEGQVDDIEMLAKAQIPLLWTRVLRYSFTDFFQQYVEKCGVDFSYDFKYAELSAMSRNFCWMLEQMGIKLCDNKNGDKVLAFFDVDNSSTIEAAWDRMMNVVRDDELADEKAGEAIDMNDDARERYADVIREQKEKQERESQEKEERRMAKSLSRLEKVYNVRKVAI